MILNIYCKICDNNNFDETFSIKTIPQDFIVRTKCKKGHDIIIYLGNPLYSLLFDNSIVAYNEQNYRSCIFEASSALERFYEDAIRVMIINHDDITNIEKINLYNITWKNIKNMSERQLGAFIMLFYKTTNKTPELLNEKFTKLRNNTIHKGYLPLKEEAYDFLEKVYNIIQTNRFIIKPYDNEAFWLLGGRVDFENYNNIKNVNENEFTLAGYDGPHFFNSTFGIDFNKSIKEYYNKYLKC